MTVPTPPAPGQSDSGGDPPVQVVLDDVVAELSERGQVEWDLAREKASRKKLAAQNAELRRALAAATNAQSGAIPAGSDG